ncbi:50S ribosomal protein L5 [Akkermansiaceae bacterium]|nr:50S ribosomal protein L5 [Akkermansiaceae bacterium]
MKPTLQCLYEEKLIKALQDELGLTNVNEVPRLEKISINSHVGHYVNERKAAVEDAVDEIGKITGQKASVVFAKKSVANFKVREGEAVGARVTLRGARMWEFLERFIAITCPNIRDFRGLPFKSFDGRGNYAVGFPDQAIFPEIELDQIKRQIGFDFIFVTSAKTDAQAKVMLKALGMPFRDNVKEEAAA